MHNEFFEFKGKDRKYKKLLDDSEFSKPQTEEEFKYIFEHGPNFLGYIDPCIPEDDDYRKSKFKKKLEEILSFTLKDKENSLNLAIKAVEDEFSLKIAPIERAIKKLDCQIFLETCYNLVTIPKPKISEASSSSQDLEN